MAISWRETDGPTLEAPSRRGFGITIIVRAVSYQLGGETEVRFAPGEFEADYVIPRSHLPKTGAVLVKDVPEQSEVSSDLPDRIPIVEDNVLIALDTSEILKEHGASRVETAPGVQTARNFHEKETFELVLLDVILGTGNSAEFAGT